MADPIWPTPPKEWPHSCDTCGRPIEWCYAGWRHAHPFGLPGGPHVAKFADAPADPPSAAQEPTADAAPTTAAPDALHGSTALQRAEELIRARLAEAWPHLAEDPEHLDQLAYQAAWSVRSLLASLAAAQVLEAARVAVHAWRYGVPEGQGGEAEEDLAVAVDAAEAAGALTPWADQPDGQSGAWEPELGPCIAERPCSVHDQPDATLTIPDSPKMLRETLCAAATAVGQRTTDLGRKASDIARLQKLIDQIDRHRPLGSDGKHGQRHTPTCGCENKEPAPDPAVSPEREAEIRAHANDAADKALTAALAEAAPEPASDPPDGFTCPCPHGGWHPLCGIHKDRNPELLAALAAYRATGGEAAPERASDGPGWERARLQMFIDGKIHGGPEEERQVEALLAHFDRMNELTDRQLRQAEGYVRRAEERAEKAEAHRDRLRGKLVEQHLADQQVRDQLDTARAELAGVTAERDRLSAALAKANNDTKRARDQRDAAEESRDQLRERLAEAATELSKAIDRNVTARQEGAADAVRHVAVEHIPAGTATWDDLQELAEDFRHGRRDVPVLRGDLGQEGGSEGETGS